MTILTSIRAIVKYHFGDYFENISEHYLNNLLILIQGLLSSRNRSISMIASDPLNTRSHTTLTRFLNHNEPFWAELEKCFCWLFPSLRTVKESLLPMTVYWINVVSAFPLFQRPLIIVQINSKTLKRYSPLGKCSTVCFVRSVSYLRPQKPKRRQRQ